MEEDNKKIENEVKDKDQAAAVEIKETKAKHKTQNLISVIILLAGLFVGSLFIDSAQLIKKSGFSVNKLSQSDIFEANGKTWVAYGEPPIPVKIINDDSCEKCHVDDILVWLRRIVPTVATEKVSYDSAAGKDLIQKFGIKTLPAFVFDNAIGKTEFYSQANSVFDQNGDQYILKTQDIGIPIGKYLELPKIDDGDAISGSKDAKVKVVVFSDFQCPYCKIFYKALSDAIAAYKDKDVVFDLKEFPLDIHPQANNAALAAECALEQNKFWEYADNLYKNQTVWSDTKNVAKFKEYARTLGLNAAQFNQCLDSKKYQTKIDNQVAEGNSFAISGTPGVFVNDQFQDGAVSSDQLKTSIDSELAK